MTNKEINITMVTRRNTIRPICQIEQIERGCNFDATTYIQLIESANYKIQQKIGKIITIPIS